MFIKVKVFTKKKHNKIIKKSENYYEIYVRAKPEKGEANKEIINLLAAYLQISESKVRLIRGFRQRNKIFEIIL